MVPYSEHLALILFIYGLAFFAMGLAIVLEAHPGSKLPLARNLWPLAAFGFLHSGVEWLDMVMVARFHENPLLGQIPVSTIRVGLLVVSSLALAWFGAALLAEAGGRRRGFLGIPPILLLLWAIVVLRDQPGGPAPFPNSSAWTSIWTRYLLYLPASLLSAAALARQVPTLRSLGMAHVAGDCRWAAYLFCANAFVAGLVVPRADFPPASFLNYETFWHAIGLPPQLLRASAALAITYFIVRVLRLFDLQVCLERERFASQALLAQEEERKRIARELHDETAQLLSSILVRLTLLGQVRSLTEVRKVQSELVSLSSRAVEGVRRLALELRPPELDDLGLEEALRWYVDEFSARWEGEARLRVTGQIHRLTPTMEMALYRIAQESLTNVAKHARAKQVTVSLQRQDGVLTLSVEDDGCGFDVEAVLAAKERGMGLFSMQERATLLGGTLQLHSRLSRGTRVSVEVPVAEGSEQR
ncbi:MAG: sensor histidine kinase [Chloroflexota bacterium]